MLFDLSHNLFMIISLVLIIVLETIFYFCLKNNKHKDWVLKAFAIITVAIHFSSLYIDYFKTGSAYLESSMLLPIYPCNIAMWLLLIVAFMKNKEGKVFKFLAEFTFYLGIIGGVIGIMFNEIYSNNPNLADYGVLKGLLSHATMLVGIIYLLVGGFIKIRVHNLLSCIIGAVGLLIDGGIIIGLYKAFNLTPPNCMYLLAPPFANYPWLNTATIGLLGVVLIFTITSVYESIALKKEDRWYSLLKEYFNKNKKLKKEEK